MWKGRWHVGSGHQSAAADRMQRRWPGHGSKGGEPFVPGSQMKGVLRHHCERLALALELEAVDPHADAESGDRKLVQHFRPLAKSSLLIDRLFGTRYQGECLFVSNAQPIAPATPDTTIVAARTAIDRVTGTVMDRHLFTTELVGPEVSLGGDIRARHPGGVLTQEGDGFPCEYALLVAGLLSLDTLGGDKSIGLGKCEVSLEPELLRWNDEVISLDDCLHSFCDEPEWDVWVDLLREESAS